LDKIRAAQREDEQREKDKVARAQRSMEEIKRFNDTAALKKAEHAKILREEDEKVAEYQRKKAEDQKYAQISKLHKLYINIVHF